MKKTLCLKKDVTPIFLSFFLSTNILFAATINTNVSGNEGIHALEVRVSSSTDDAEERMTSSRVTLISSDLELVNEGNVLRNQLVGLRFNDISIPSGAEIKNAYIQFQVDEVDSSLTSLTIEAEDSDNAETFSSDDGNISDRMRTSSSIVWNPASWSVVGSEGVNQQTPDISLLVQEIISRADWFKGNSIVFIMSGSGRRVAESFDAKPLAAPLLHIEYTGGNDVNESPVVSNITIGGLAKIGQELIGRYNYSDSDGDIEGATTYRWLRNGVAIDNAILPNYTLVAADQDENIVFEVTPIAKTGVMFGNTVQSLSVGPIETASGVQDIRISSSSDDAEEDVSSHRVSLISSDLELVNNGRGLKNQLLGLRFNNLLIPSGATVNKAYIQFQVDETDSTSTSVTIKGEDSNNAAIFSSNNGNISGRVQTLASVVWSPEPWLIVGEAGTRQKTPDVSAIIQEIVDGSGWAVGHSLAFIISGGGRRVAESFDGKSTAAPILHIEYSDGDNPNHSPTANNVVITGRTEIEYKLTGNYTYTDVDNDKEGGSTYRWLKNGQPISGATSQSYILVNEDQGAMISFEVTPVASTGISLGVTTQSTEVGRIKARQVHVADVSVSSGFDDVEEVVSSGRVILTSSDLEIVIEGADQLLVGLRFRHIAIPSGSTISSANILFTSDETDSEATDLVFHAEASGNSLGFDSTTNNVSNRLTTTAFVSWSDVPAWNTVGEEYQTPDLSTLIQEVIDRPEWTDNSALSIIVSGSGKRVVKSYEGSTLDAPKLQLEFIPKPDVISPTAPLSLKATADSSSQIRLSWNSSSDNNSIAGYTVYRCTDESCKSKTVIDTIASTRFTDKALVESTRYYYTVDAFDSSGNISSIASSANDTTLKSGGFISFKFVGAGDIATSGSSTGNAEATAKILDSIIADNPETVVFTAGDNAYTDGTTEDFLKKYEPTWGRHRSRTFPSPGNHDYIVPGAQDYLDYFCKTSTDCAFPGGTQKLYYSYDLGNWHIISLDSQGDHGKDSAQVAWLKQDLADNPDTCILAYVHHPYYSSGRHGSSSRPTEFWKLLYAAGADVVVAGHEHLYERFAKQDLDGNLDSKGIRSFIVGTGGAGLYSFDHDAPNSEVKYNNSHGIISFTLFPDRYDWEFISREGFSFSDTGSGICNTQIQE